MKQEEEAMPRPKARRMSVLKGEESSLDATIRPKMLFLMLIFIHNDNNDNQMEISRFQWHFNEKIGENAAPFG